MILNSVESYIREAVKVQDGCRIKITELYEAYCHWCQLHEVRPQTSNMVTKRMKELGVETTKTYYLGVAGQAVDAYIDEDIYCDLFTKRAPRLLPVLEAWLKSDRAEPLALVLAEAVNTRFQEILEVLA